MQKDIDFYERVVEINAMAMAWDVFYVFDREIGVESINNCKRFSFLNCAWRNYEEIASWATQFYPGSILYSEDKCYKFRNRTVRKV